MFFDQGLGYEVDLRQDTKKYRAQCRELIVSDELGKRAGFGV